MSSEQRIKKLPEGMQKFLKFLGKIKLPAKVTYIAVSILATLWFLIRVIPKPSRASYPCMQVVSPIMSSFVVWLLSVTGAIFAFKNARSKFYQARYLAALGFVVTGIVFIAFQHTTSQAKPANEPLQIWYKPNVPLGEAKGIFPGRVVWGHDPKIASWDGKTGFWWEDQCNNQQETNKLLSQTLTKLTEKKSDKEAWNDLFVFFNQTKHQKSQGYQTGEKIAIKINMNNTDAHENTNRINANPQLIFALLSSLINDGGVPQEQITVADPSRFITNDIYDKCHAAFPKVHFVDHNGGDGREAATFVKNGFTYSYDFDNMTHDLATCFVEANYVINVALMKGHVGQGVTLSSKNFFGCTSIETDWRKNAHGSGFSQSREGKRQYSVYPDFMGHKDLGGKTMLFLIDGIYGNKFVDGVPEFRWNLSPFNNQWPNSLFASQDGVAIESVVLDFALTEWPDAPEMMYSDYAMEEMALANNPPSGAVYDPERDGTRLSSLGTTEHWNNSRDKQYSRNLKTGNGIELIYQFVK